MRKIAVINYKGGTGKTTSVVNLAYALSMTGKKVLLIDTDPQGSSGYYLGIKSDKTLYDLIIENVAIQDCIQPARHNLDIICSNEHVFPAELKMGRMNERELVLSKKLQDLYGYDFVFLDCAPSMNLLNQNALLFANEVVLPVSMEYLSLIGVKQLLKNIKIINRIFSKKVKITTVIPTFYDKRHKKSKDIIGSLKRVFPNMVSSPVRVSISLSEAPGKKMTIFEYDPHCEAAEDYYKIMEEIVSYGK
ncbi:ParA family protein [Candidatus Marinamargulisbacteria bacterium SCGC AG-343-D04]|nr:ParA family protein [Candidatus Marinamargulisbacteria bacterium SCGC AG-343-D04]